jgi:phytol kinase
MNDWLGLLISLLYIFSLFGLAEALRRWRRYSSNFTRKVIHIGVGMLSWGLHYLFEAPGFFIAACIAFMVLNLLDWRYGFFTFMASGDRSNLGTVYFPLMAGVAALLFWDRPPLLVAALMPLTWGDGLASVIGRRYGRHPYRVRTGTRTIEGSAGFFAACYVFTWLALWLPNGLPSITPVGALLPALIVAVLTTLVEAVSIWGLDNITITAASILVLSIWPF